MSQTAAQKDSQNTIVDVCLSDGGGNGMRKKSRLANFQEYKLFDEHEAAVCAYRWDSLDHINR